AQFFEDVMFVGGHVLSFLKEVVKAFVSIGTQTSIAETFSQLASTVKASFATFFKHLADVGTYIARAFNSAIELGNKIGQNQGFQTFFKVIKACIDIVTNLINITWVGTIIGWVAP